MPVEFRVRRACLAWHATTLNVDLDATYRPNTGRTSAPIEFCKPWTKFPTTSVPCPTPSYYSTTDLTFCRMKTRAARASMLSSRLRFTPCTQCVHFTLPIVPLVFRASPHHAP